MEKKMETLGPCKGRYRDYIGVCIGFRVSFPQHYPGAPMKLLLGRVLGLECRDQEGRQGLGRGPFSGEPQMRVRLRVSIWVVSKNLS